MAGLSKVANKPLGFMQKAHDKPLKWMGIEDSKVGKAMSAVHNKPLEWTEKANERPAVWVGDKPKKPTTASTVAGGGYS